MSSGHINLNAEFQGVRRFLFFIIACFVFVYFFLKKKINIPISNPLFLLPFLTSLIFSFFYLVRLNLYHFSGWLFAALIFILIWNLRHNQIILFFKRYLIFSSILICFGLTIVYLTNLDSQNFNYVNPYRLSIFKVFSNSDSFTFSDQIPLKKSFRFSFFLQQSSLVVTYIFLPLVIYSLFKRPNIYVLIICFIAIIFSYSSTVYISIFFGFCIFIIFNFFCKNYKIIFYLFFISSIFFGLFFFLNFKMQSNYDSLGLELNNYKFLRISSGAYRLEYIGNQVYFFLTKYFFGFISHNESIEQFTIGNFFITSGIKGGFICLIITFFYIFKIYKTIIFNKKINKLASSMLLSCILLLTNFQDFGISSISGFIFFSLLAKLLCSEQ
jgi:hypothetical protein